jgi:hypothetical protein
MLRIHQRFGATEADKTDFRRERGHDSD